MEELTRKVALRAASARSAGPPFSKKSEKSPRISMAGKEPTDKRLDATDRSGPLHSQS